MKMPKVGIINEVALYVEDALKAANFYMDLFGFMPSDEVDELWSVLYVSAEQVLILSSRKDDRKVKAGDTFIQRYAGDRGPQHICFAIIESDFEAWETRLTNKGIEVIRRVEWPEGGRSLYFNDLDGHEIEVKSATWDGQLYQSVQPTRVVNPDA